MLKNIKLTNFQSHIKTSIALSPGVNVFIGKSDAGKSSIVRALYWLLFNRPLGDDFRTYGTSKTEVEIELDEHRIIRAKSDSENAYRVDEVVLKAFGQEVPEEVVNIHKVSSVLNVQTQISPLFLLQASAGEVARFLNQIAGLGEIDLAISKLTRMAGQLRDRQALLDQRSSELAEQLKRFSYLEQAEDILERAKVLQNKSEEKRKLHTAITKTTIQIKQLETILQDSQVRLQSVKSIWEQVSNTYNMCGSLQQKSKALADILKRINSVRQEISRQKEKLAIRPVVIDSLALVEKKEQLQRKWQEIYSCVDVIRKKRAALADANKVLANLKKEFMENMPPICPLCGQEIRR